MSVVVPHLNTVVVAGRCTHDPETRYTNAGVPCSTFQIGLKTRRFRDGHVQYEDSYCQVTVAGPRAEWVGSNLMTGSPIVVEGQLSEARWHAGGQLRRKVRIMADRIEKLERDEYVSDTGDAEDENEGAKEGAPVSSTDASEARATPGPDTDAGEDDPIRGAEEAEGEAS